MNMNWNEFAISAIGDVIGGGTPSTKHNEYYGDEIAWITPKDLSNFNGRYISRGERSISQKGYDNSSAQMMPAGTVLFSSRAPIGYVAIAKNELCTNQGFNSVVPHSEICDSEFLYYLLCYRKHDIKAIASGTTFMEVSGTALKNFVVHMPDISTQKKIASVLSSLDQRIEGNNLINHNLEEQAKAIFKSWFVDFEPFQDERFVETEYGSIPKSWRLITLGEVTEEIRTKVKNKTTTVFSAIKTGELTPSEEYFTKQVYSKDISKYIEVAPLTFAYNPARVNIGSLGLNKFPYTGCVSPVYVVFKSESEYHHFFDFTFKRAFFREEVRVRASGSVRQSLSYADFSLIKIIYPPNDVFEKFNQIYGKISASIRHNQKEIQTLAQLRDVLLPKLMSGEIDVSEVQV